MMNEKTIIVGGLVVIVLCVGLSTFVAPIVDLGQTQAETSQVEAETELTEAKTEDKTLETFTIIIQDLLAELRTERRFQRESLQEILALVEQLTELLILAIVGNLVLMAILMLTVIVGGIVGIVALLRWKRRPVLMLPRNQAQPWLPVGDASTIPYQTQDAIQMVDLGQEIVIE